MMKKIFILWSLLFILIGSVYSADATGENVAFGFNRGLDFYRWEFKNLNHLRFAGEEFQSDGNYYVLLRQPPGFPDQWKTSVKFNALWSKTIKPGFQWRGNLSTDYFYDRQVSQTPLFFFNPLYPGSFIYSPSSTRLTTGLNNQIYRQSAEIGMNIRKYSRINLKPSAGVYGEQVMGSSAVGPTGNIAVDWDSLELGGYDTDFSASGNGQFMAGRKHQEVEAEFKAEKTYSKQSTNSFSALYRNYIYDFPVSGGATDRRRESEYRFNDGLKYNVIGPLDFKLDLKLARRKVEPSSFNQTNRLIEFSTGLTAGLEGKVSGHLLNLSLNSEGQNQTYPLRKVEGRQYNLWANANFYLQDDSLKFTGALSRFKYDISPEEYGLDTRDELRHSYALFHYHPLSQGLNLETQLRTDLYHLVYLESERSGDNNWERFFLLSPAVRYQCREWNQLARFSVSAHFYDYDFPQSEASSRIYRKYSADDSLYINLARNWALELHYLLLLEDQGQLDWDAFIQELSDKYQTHNGSLVLVRSERRLRYRLGWGYYQRKGYHMEAGGEMSGGEEVISSGPLFGVSGTGPYNLQVQMSGNFMWVEETDKTPYTLSTIDFTVIKYF